MKKIAWLLLLMICFTGTGITAPGQSILKMMRTPVTAFDFFLFELEESCKCEKWFGNPNWRSDPCLTLMEYNIEEDLIYLNFYVHDPSRSSTYMRGFTSGSDAQKEQILRKAVERLAVVVGVAERPGTGKPYGLIQVTPIRRGWFNPDFKEAELKDDVVRRTVLTLQTKFQAKLYRVERKNDGQVLYEVLAEAETRPEQRQAPEQ